MASKVMPVVAVRDRGIDAFSQPIVVQHLNVAIRSFSDEVKNPQSELSKHPDDYDLYHLADFDPDTGRFANVGDSPTMIAIGKSFVQS